MDLPIYIIDAFAERPLTGNPAAVCPLEAWLPAATMQAIASEMNLSETVFFAPDQQRNGFGIRWFTPTREVDLIGHATLAAGFLVLERLQPNAASVRFLSGGDELVVARDLDRSLWTCRPCDRGPSRHPPRWCRDWAGAPGRCWPPNIICASSITPMTSQH